VLTDGLLEKVIVPAVVAPIMAFVAAGGAILITYRMVGRLRPGPVNRGYRLGQIASASLLSLSHGTNDAQKTMGIITLALVAHGNLAGANPSPPTWVVVSAATAIALGTYSGGWRIIRTMGSRIFKMDPAQGFAAQSGGAAVLLTAAHLGFPLSTTHSITGAVLGAGAAKRLSAVRWGLAGNIVVAWVLTLPAAAAVGALTYGLSRIFGEGALGPLLISIFLLALMAGIFAQRLRRGPALSTSAADT
jgi:PiT family inorganic phosphate transporter